MKFHNYLFKIQIFRAGDFQNFCMEKIYLRGFLLFFLKTLENLRIFSVERGICPPIAPLVTHLQKNLMKISWELKHIFIQKYRVILKVRK